MKFHELKDIVMTFSSKPGGKTDDSWDDAEVSVWNPIEQQSMKLLFAGSSKSMNDENQRRIHFLASPVGNNHLVTDAFKDALKKIFPNIREETLAEYTKVFVKSLVELKK